MDKLNNHIEFNEAEHKYILFGIEIPSVSSIIDFAGYKSSIAIDPIYRDRGTFIHMITEVIDKEGIIDYSVIPSEWFPFVSAYEWFLADEEYKVFKSEYLLFHDEYFYCGTADREYENGVQCDIKTGFYQSWHEIQLAAYMMCSGCDKGMNLYLMKDGQYKVRFAKNIYLAKQRFISSVQGYWFHRKRDFSRLSAAVMEFKECL